MICPGCGAEGHETVLGLWCDACGGVAIRKGPNGPELLFRHVATLDGKGGRFPIVYDYSTSDYSMAYQREVKEFVKVRDEWVQRVKTFTNHGTLDAVIALGQPHAKGDGEENPGLYAAPSATEEEKRLL